MPFETREIEGIIQQLDHARYGLYIDDTLGARGWHEAEGTLRVKTRPHGRQQLEAQNALVSPFTIEDVHKFEEPEMPRLTLKYLW